MRWLNYTPFPEKHNYSQYPDLFQSRNKLIVPYHITYKRLKFICGLKTPEIIRSLRYERNQGGIVTLLLNGWAIIVRSLRDEYIRRLAAGAFEVGRHRGDLLGGKAELGKREKVFVIGIGRGGKIGYIIVRRSE